MLCPLLLAAGLTCVQAQTSFDLSQGNFAEPFDDIGTWTSPTTRSWSGVAAGGTATIPNATKITAASATFVTSASGGVQRGTGNLQLLSTGSGDNSTSAALDLNLVSTGRQLASLSFDTACVFNGTGNRAGTLRIYYTTDATTWTELTGTNLPFTATNNVASSASISFDPPVGLDNQASLKLRFYYHNGTGGTTGSRPKISIDNLSITSSALGDTTPPTLASLAPANGATDVAVTSTLDLTLSEPVTKGTGDITVWRASDQTAVFTIPVTSTAVAIADSKVTVTPPSVLAGSTGFYVTVAAGAFKDVAGNAFAGISDSATWTFTTRSSDTTAPALVTTSPAAASTTAFPTSNLVLEFDEALVAGSGSVTIRKASDGTEVETLAVPSAGVVISGSTATVNPASILAYGTAYYVEVASGSFKDASGNGTAAIAGSSAWAFTTRSAPQLVISQYYEGAGSDRYIELKNLGDQPLALDGYRLVTWTDTAPSDNEGWKSGTATSVRTTALDGQIIPAGGHFLVANNGVTNPAYAAVNPDLTTPAPTGLPDDPVPVTAFNGDDSIVLYKGSGFTRDEVVDAVSFSANQGTDLSFYRLDNALQGFDFTTGSSILDFSTVWGSKTLAQVAAATSADPWYLSASRAVTSLTLAVSPSTFSEAGGAQVATATVTRDGSTADDLFVNIESSDASEASAAILVTIPAGQTSVTFTVDAVNDAYRDGNQKVTLRVYADGYLGASQVLTVEDESTDPPLPVVINEVDADTPGTDTAEFVELHNPTNEEISLDGLVLVLYNGSNDLSYWAKDLTGSKIPAKGYFVVGNLLAPNANLTDLPDNTLQNGADAVALYAGAVTAFPNNTAVASATGTLLDAVVYGTDDANDTGLLAALTPGMVQLNEGSAANTLNVSIARSGDSGTALSTATWVAQLPSPGAANPVPVAITTQPQAASISAGQTATLTVTASGSDPITYQWYEGLAGATDKPVGTNSASFTSPVLTATTSYWVRVSNAGRSVDSSVVEVTVAPAGFAAWASANAPGQSASQDHDGDGVANGVEFFMGLSGSAFTANPTIVGGKVTWPNGGALAPAVYGTAFVVQTSADLAAWTNVDAADPRLSNSAGEVSFSPGATAGRIFIRLKVDP